LHPPKLFSTTVAFFNRRSFSEGGSEKGSEKGSEEGSEGG